ncbi:hypothetical protein [Streptomyces hokutonensis]|uniref:hypothetical protein n=1 Tax=Streptomyces hokutonensis TaxID=1306990 RepID=UPI00131A0164|nr:hypothetical protein [Streptomyces hokutonensis]
MTEIPADGVGHGPQWIEVTDHLKQLVVDAGLAVGESDGHGLARVDVVQAGGDVPVGVARSGCSSCCGVSPSGLTPGRAGFAALSTRFPVGGVLAAIPLQVQIDDRDDFFTVS